MNILFLTPQLPFPPRQGTALRNWGLIKHLAARHAITLLSFAEAGQSADSAELRAACRRIVAVPAPRRSRADRLRTLFSPHPDLARRLWSPDFARALTDLLQESRFDLVHIEGLEMAPYLPLLRGTGLPSPVSNSHPPAAVQASNFELRTSHFELPTSRSPTVQLVYDAHNAEHVLQRRALVTDTRQPARWPAALYSWLQLPRLQKFEAEVCRTVDTVTCVSAEDAAALRRLVPSLQPVILPNGIDVQDYARYAISRSIPLGRDTPAATHSGLVFTGKLDYRPNIDAALWFAGEILPRIRAARPGVQFVVVGQKPVERLQKLSGQNGVAVTGAVEDVRPFIAEAAVYVAPLRMGGGTRFKLLEAMALARPIVSTIVGAEGFAVRSGRELLLADAPADFAAAVLSLLADPARASALGQTGRAFVQAGYDWSAIIPKLEAAYGRKGAQGTEGT